MGDLPFHTEIAEDILIHLDEADDLARASAVCTTFRSAAAGPHFLRRFRSLHPPPVLGVLANAENHGGVLLHAEPPQRPGPAARALAQAADFSFSFIPRIFSFIPSWAPNYSDRDWRVLGALDGRVLLSLDGIHNSALDLVVCDPLHRRYVRIPAIPGDLLDNNIKCIGDDYLDFERFLAPPSVEDQEKNELSFRVICNVRSAYKVVTLVFSSITGNWQCATSISFLPYRWIHDIRHFRRFYMRGCFYWTQGTQSSSGGIYYMLVLDPLEMKLNVVKFQLRVHHIDAIVDEGKGTLSVVFITNFRHKQLYCGLLENHEAGAVVWYEAIPMPDEEEIYFWYILDAADSYLLLKGSSLDLDKTDYYILELKTGSFQRLRVSETLELKHQHLYASFPPPLSLPTI